MVKVILIIMCTLLSLILGLFYRDEIIKVFEGTRKVIAQCMKLDEEQKEVNPPLEKDVDPEVHKEGKYMDNSTNNEKDSDKKVKHMETNPKSIEREETDASKKKVVPKDEKHSVGGGEDITLEDIRTIFRNINWVPSEVHKKKETGGRIKKEENISRLEVLSEEDY